MSCTCKYGAGLAGVCGFCKYRKATNKRLEKLETAHTEALDALEKLQAAQKHVLEVMCAGEDAYMAAFDGAEAILAKAGRR